MTGNTRNPVELLVQQIHKGQYCANKLPVRKIYIDEDPAKEQMVPCPRCLDRDQQNMVRYLFINLSEAIYKCEAYDCMYPFRNFKFKNFEECSVYRYELQTHQHEVDTNHAKNVSSSCNTYETPVEHIAALDFNVDFFSFDGLSDKTLDCTAEPPAPPVFAQTARSSDPTTMNFDTGFIDEILQDLFPASLSTVTNVTEAAESKKVSSKTTSTGTSKVHSPCKPVTPSSSIGRKLEKCLKIFEKPCKASEDDVFKKPKSPVKDNLVVEHISPTRLRIKRVSEVNSTTHTTPDGNKHRERIAKVLPLDVGSNGTLKSKQARSLVKNKKLKPLDLVCKLNTMTQKATASSTVLYQQPTVRKGFNSAKVQKMLSFIQRSMKTCDESESSSPQTVPNKGAEVAERTRNLHIKIEPMPHPNTLPASTVMQDTKLSCAGEPVNKPHPTIADRKYPSKLSTNSASGGMEMLFHFMES